MASLHRLDKTPRRNPIHERRVYLFRHVRKGLPDRKPRRDFKVQVLLSLLGRYVTRSKCECEAFAPNFHITTNSPSRLRGCELCAGKHAWLCRKKLSPSEADPYATVICSEATNRSAFALARRRPRRLAGSCAAALALPAFTTAQHETRQIPFLGA
jgi:hypothetical protein